MKNCWEIMNCGQEDCPARSTTLCDGVHNGKNGGRCCWQIAGTQCSDVMFYGGDGEGKHAKNITSCLFCKVYLQVKKEEGDNFKMMHRQCCDENLAVKLNNIKG